MQKLYRIYNIFVKLIELFYHYNRLSFSFIVVYAMKHIVQNLFFDAHFSFHILFVVARASFAVKKSRFIRSIFCCCEMFSTNTRRTTNHKKGHIALCDMSLFHLRMLIRSNPVQI